MGPTAADEAKDLEALKGTWTVADISYNGKDHSALKLTFSFTGNEIVVEGNDQVKLEYARLKIKLDPATSPKIIDFTVGDGVQKGAAMEGIYDLKNNELRMCIKVFGKDRPNDFTAPAGSSTALLVLKRANP